MKLPLDVRQVTEAYLDLLEQHLPCELVGLYLHGSIALGAYQPGVSDVDFITLTDRKLVEEDMGALKSIHLDLARRFETTEMDGVYATVDSIGEIDHQNSSTKYIYYNEGSLSYGSYFNFNPVTWWIFKECGIPIVGKDPSSFDFLISARNLHTYVKDNMNTYWVRRVESLQNSAEKFSLCSLETSNEEIEWTVLGLLRQYYTLQENNIVSKSAAGEYGLAHLPEEWHKTIQDALNVRARNLSGNSNSDAERLQEAVEFASYLIESCKTIPEPAH